MPQQKASVLENTFGQGFITEASGLNFPKDAATDVDNVVFNTDMTVERRLGLDWENSTRSVETRQSKTVTEYLWKNVAGTGDRSITCIQVGSIIKFYETSNTTTISSNLITSFDISGYKLASSKTLADFQAQKCQFTEGNGKLYIAHPYMDPVEITYDSGTLIPATISLTIRDLQGELTDPYPDITSPASPADIRHVYNLYNQGWDVSAPAGFDKDNIGDTTNILQYYVGVDNIYPSNVAYWWSSKDALGQFNIKLLNSVSIGNKKAPRGNFIVNPFLIDRYGLLISKSSYPPGSISGTSASFTVETSNGIRPSVITFFSGRCFYAGVNYNTTVANYSNKIYFSRIIENKSQLSQCYQDGDPTAEEGSDLQPSDGGVIQIPEISTVYKLFPVGYSLLIFASNGVWALTGSTGIGFTAKDYTIAKLSSQGMLNATSFADVDGAPVWWSLTGINTLVGGGDQNGLGQVTSMTDNTIKTFYDSIPGTSKSWVKGTYDRDNKQIVWLYNSSSVSTIDDKNTFDSALTYNVITKAFSKYTFPANNKLIGLINLTTIDNRNQLKFLMADPTASIGFGQLSRTDYTDFGTNYDSYIDTGYGLYGQGIGKFYTPYVFVYLDGRNQSELNFFHKWNFANSVNTNKWSLPQHVYTSSGFDYETVRKKVRGNGKAVVMRFQSITNKPFRLIGWSLNVLVLNAP